MTAISDRDAALRQMLSERRREIDEDVRGRVRGGLATGQHEGSDDLERSDSRVQADIELVLIQARAEMVTRIDEALKRLDAGHYGSCRECAGAIAERRLSALPFAIRCQACEDKREREIARARSLVERRDRVALFADTIGR